jgi:hypothetical protein
MRRLFAKGGKYEKQKEKKNFYHFMGRNIHVLGHFCIGSDAHHQRMNPANKLSDSGSSAALTSVALPIKLTVAAGFSLR